MYEWVSKFFWILYDDDIERHINHPEDMVMYISVYLVNDIQPVSPTYYYYFIKY